MASDAIVTRFAPSPTGPLHLGHAYSAILAHDMARASGGRFLLRMEDIDTDRCRPEWVAAILDDLAWLGLTWDGPVQTQADHVPAYQNSLERIFEHGFAYPCSCSRGDIRAALAAPQEGVDVAVYPGTCRARPMTDHRPGDAIRLDMARTFASLASPPTFTETGPAHAGRHVLDDEAARHRIGDVVLARKGDGVVAYFLASALDDARDGITHVIRGDDLFAFTPVQVMLQRLLGLPTPVYHHHILIRDAAGKRLAKRDDARAIRKFRAEGATPADIRRMVGLHRG